MHDHPGVELDVGVELATRLQLGQHVDRRALDGLRELDQRATEALGDRAQEHRARVVGLVDAVAEAHDALAALDGGADVGVGALGCADGVQHVEGAAGGPAVEWSRQRADGGDDGGAEVRPGGRDDACREGRRVEAVVDGEDHVLLNGPGVQWARLLARQHEEVVGGEAQVAPRLDRLVPGAQPVRRGQDRRHHRAQADGLVVQLVGVDVVGGAPTQLRAEDGHRGAQDVERRSPTRQRRQQRGEPRRHDTPPPHLVGKGGRGHRVGQLAPEEEMPDVLERALLGQVDGRVLPVVEEALLAAHVADGRLRHHHALQAGRHVPTGLGGGPDAGHAHEVAQRDHADAALILHHRQVAVVVRGQAGPRRVDSLLGPQHIGSGGHPEPHLLTAGVPVAGRRPQQVALGEDAHHLAVVGHDDRSGVGLLHHVGRRGQAVVGRAGHRRGGHEVAHCGLHAVHYAAATCRCKC